MYDHYWNHYQYKKINFDNQRRFHHQINNGSASLSGCRTTFQPDTMVAGPNVPPSEVRFHSRTFSLNLVIITYDFKSKWLNSAPV